MGSIISGIWGGIDNSRATGAAANVVTGTDQEIAQRVQDAVSQGITRGQAGLGDAQGALRQGVADYNKQIDWGLNRANPLLADFYNQGVTALTPYMRGGEGAFNQLTQLTAPGSSFMKPFDASMMATQDPGYQFRMQQGMKALQASGAARGASLGGAALRESQRYGQGMASDEYQNAFNRYMQNRSQTFGMLNTLANYGSQATNEYLNLGQTTAGRMAGNLMAAGQGKAGAALSAAEQYAPMAVNEGNFLANFGLGGQEQVGNWLDKSAQSQAAGILGQNAARGQIIGGIGQGVNAAILGGLGAAGVGDFAGGWEGFGQGIGQGLGLPGMGPRATQWDRYGSTPFDPNAPGTNGGLYSRELSPNDPFWTSGAGASGAPPNISGYFNPPSVPGSFWPTAPTIPWQPVGTQTAG